MAKTFTLQPVSKLQENPKVHRTSANLPPEETMRYLFSYARALQVLNSNITGKTLVILN